MALLEDLATISEGLQDDLQGVDPTQDYPDALPPAPPAEGNYRAKISYLAGQKDRSGNLKFQLDSNGNKFPTLVYSASIIEPGEQENHRLFSFESIYTRPFQRNGVTANALMDLTRSLDSSRGWRTVSEGIALLKELAETGTFRCRVRWEAYDAEYAKTLKEERLRLSGVSELTKDQMNAINKEVSIVGMKKFDQDPSTGKYLPRVKHPISGNILTPRVRVAQLFPSHQEGVKIG